MNIPVSHQSESIPSLSHCHPYLTSLSHHYPKALPQGLSKFALPPGGPGHAPWASAQRVLHHRNSRRQWTSDIFLLRGCAVR